MTEGQIHIRLSGFYLAYFAFIGAFAPYWALYLKSLGFNAAEIGVLISINPVARIFGPALWGWLADHSGRRMRIVRVTLCIMFLVFCAVFYARTYLTMILVMMVLNIFWSAVLPVAEASTFHLLRGHVGVYARIRLWGSVGFVIVVIFGGHLLDAHGIQAVAPLALMMLSMTVIAGFGMPDDPAPSTAARPAPIMGLILRPRVLALFAGFFFMQVAHGPYGTFYSIFLVDEGYSKATVGWLWALGVIAEIVLFLWMARIIKRIPLHQILAVSFLVAGLRFMMIAWGSGSLTVLVLAQILHAVTFGAFHVAAVAVMHQIFAGPYAARGQALYTSIGYGVGGAVGGLASGYAWDAIGPHWTFTLGAVAALLAWITVAIWPLEMRQDSSSRGPARP
jgi:PPP family 3-phenylpropionic acid transporter